MSALSDLAQRMEARFANAKEVADALMYEGYILYPYATDGKNQGGARFQWGVLVPPAWAEIDPSERSATRTELIVDPEDEPVIAIRLRFLQLQRRSLEVADADAVGGFRPITRLVVGEQVWMEWDEAIEHQVDLGVIALLPLADAAPTVSLEFPASQGTEIVATAPAATAPAGRITRTTQPVAMVARVTTRWADGLNELVKVTIEVENTTPWFDRRAGREDVMRRSLISVHTLAAVEGGAFCSLFDPPERAVEAVAGCRGIGSYPVLVGAAGATDLVLGSPIILYDYPAIAPESEGDFHDGCEIDEILALRVLTLTERERAEARVTDPRSRAIVDRCDNMANHSWNKLHGVMRDSGDPVGDRDPVEPEPRDWLDPAIDAQFDPWTDTVAIDSFGTGSFDIGRGSPVRLRPRPGADGHDMFLAGLAATVAGVFHDVDGGIHVAVTVDGDPARELYAEQGRFYYFHPDELEPVPATAGAGRSGENGAGTAEGAVGEASQAAE